MEKTLAVEFSECLAGSRSSTGTENIEYLFHFGNYPWDGGTINSPLLVACLGSELLDFLLFTFPYMRLAPIKTNPLATEGKVGGKKRLLWNIVNKH